VDVKHIAAQQLDFTLYDAFGRIVRQRRTDFSDTLRTSWNVHELPAGMYLLQIRADKRLVKVEKVVISR
ncbi:MAG: T9SS type A sorting domain-containing protein, partial [Bacteroidota bacterium]